MKIYCPNCGKKIVYNPEFIENICQNCMHGLQIKMWVIPKIRYKDVMKWMKKKQ